MNLDAPHNLFVTILAVSAAGLVAATAYEADVLAPRPETAAVPPAAEAPEAPDDGVSALVESEPSLDGSGGVPPMEVPVEEPALSDDMAEIAEAAPAEAPVVEAPVVEEPAVVPPPPSADDGVAWAPLREGTRSEPCLVWANRALMATGLARREPVGTDGPFTANGEPLVVFMDFANSTGVSQEVTVVWTHGESGVTHVDTTEAGTGSRWRTWVERPFALDELGPWTVELVDAERCQIAGVSFELVAPDW